MTPLDGKYSPQINALKEKLDSLKEPYLLIQKENESPYIHSEIWNKTFNALIKISKEYSKKRWPYFETEFLIKSYNVQFISSSFTYEKCIITILKNYNPNKLDKNGKPVTFWHYYTYVLGRELSKRSSAVKLQYLNSNTTRAAKLPVRTQRKINKMLRIVKIWNAHHPNENPITIDSEYAKKLFLQEENFLKSAEELDKILLLNKSLYLGKKENEKALNSVSHDFSLETENLSQEEIIKNIANFFIFLDKCFINKMELKHDKSQESRKSFCKQVFTLYFLTKLTKIAKSIDTETIIYSFHTKAPQVFDNQIAKEFLDKENYILKSCTNKIQDPTKKLSIKNLERRMKPTLESISEKNGKNKNYGNRRLKDFKDFCLSQNEKTTDENLKKIFNYILK